MKPGLLYALLCASCFGLWTVLHAAASRHISSTLGAILVSGFAVVVGLFFVIPGIRSGSLEWSLRGLMLVAFAGACAFAIDYFALKAYGSGLPISIGGPIIIGGSMALASVIGLALGEPISILKVVAILLIGIGASILGTLSPQ